jgi:hypothetical protein
MSSKTKKTKTAKKLPKLIIVEEGETMEPTMEPTIVEEGETMVEEKETMKQPQLINDETVVVDEIEERKTTIHLQLGDVIHLEDPFDDLFNNHTFYIDYIDKHLIKLIDVDDMSMIRIKIKENGQLGEGTITKISLLFRNDEQGYARQNNLLPDTWVNIHFGGELPVIITGEITNIEEDMIEVRTYPEKDTIYINFACQGIPEHMNIDKIEIRKKPELSRRKEEEVVEEKEQDVELEKEELGEELGEESIPISFDDEYQDDEFEREQEEEEEEEGKLEKTVGIKGLRGMIIKADEVVTGRQMGKIKELVEVDVSKQRFNIAAQTNDLLDELLSKVPISNRTDNVKKNIHIMIERFKQLRTEYSKFDTHGIVTGSNIKTANWKPLAQDLINLNTSLYWVVPVAKNVKKIYDVNANEETNYPDVLPLELYDNLGNFINSIRQYDAVTEHNKYVELMNKVNTFFTPFEDINTRSDYAEDILAEINVSSDLNVVIDNLNDFQSSIVKNEAIHTKKFAIQKYNTGITYLQSLDTTSRSKFLVRRNEVAHGDTLALKSILTLPEPTIRFSHVNLPSTNILEKSNLNTNFLDYWRVLNKKTFINPVVVSVSDINNGVPINFDEVNYANDIKNYTLNIDTDEKEELNENNERKSIRKMTKPEIYSAFTQTIVPQTRVLFNLMKKYIHGKLSFVDVVSYLEPFRIYTKDITFMQYKTIQHFIYESISTHNKKFIENGKLFKTFIKNNDSFYSYYNPKNNIINLLLPNNVSEIEDGYDYHSKFTKQSSNYRNKREDTSFYLTNGELLTLFSQIDFGKLFNSAISLENVKLMFPKDLMKILEDEKTIMGEAVKDAEKANKCQTYVVAKQYQSEEELNADNGKTIYYDKKYDTTDYSILNKYESDKYNMPPDIFLPYIIDKLVTKHNFSQNDAEIDAETMLNGFKTVQNGDLAKVYDDRTTTLSFYKREQNRWTKENSITEDMVVNDPSMLCNFQKDCIDVQKKHAPVCESYDLNKKEMKENALKDIVKQFDKKFQYSKEELEYIIHQQFDYCSKNIVKLREMKQRDAMKYNNQQYKIGVKNGLSALNETDETAVVQSPYLPLRDLIISTTDFVKKQRNIVRFAKTFTREALAKKPSETQHWRYCILTNTPLLPTFFYTLASCFIEQPDNYLRTMNEIMKESGKLSDDGDRWVDEHTGRTICMIDFAIDEGYEGGFKIVSRDLLEQDLGDAILNNDKKPIVFETAQTKKISNIITALSGFMGLKIEEQREFIIRLVNDVLVVALPSKEDYEKRAAQEELKKQKGVASKPSYTSFENMTILYLTLGAFLIGVQVSIPSVKTKKTFPGCVRSFSGYPFEGEGDSSGLDYLVCVANKISRSTEPWNSISKVKPDVISKNIRNFINKYYCDPKSPVYNTVKHKFQEKTNYLLTNPNIGVIPEEHALLKRWPHFLPPLHSFKIKANELNQVSDGFITSLKHDISSGSRGQQEKLLVVKSKIIFLSLELQSKIQKIIQKKQLLLTNGLNEPFLENACCNEKKVAVVTALQYFEKDDAEIHELNEKVSFLSNLLNNITGITKAPYLFSRENTKNIYASTNAEFSNDTIYRAFITFCKLNTSTPLDPTLQAICSEKSKSKKDDLDDDSGIIERKSCCSFVKPIGKGIGVEPMNDIIQRMERDGVKYSNADFERLMNIVNKRNEVHITIDKPVANYSQNLQMIVQELTDTETKDKGINKLFKHIETTLGASVADIASVDDVMEVRALKNYLYEFNEKMKTDLNTFLETNSEMSKKQMKNVKLFVNNINKWSNSKDNSFSLISDDVAYSNFQFLKNTIIDILKIFPTIILNNVSNFEFDDKKYMGLSSAHTNKLSRFIREYYEKLKPFYDNPLIKNVIHEMKMETVDFITFVNNIQYFTEIQYKDLRLHFMFDKMMCDLLIECCFLHSCMIYVRLANDETMIQISGLEEMEGEGGNFLDLKRKVANLLCAFLQISMDNKDHLDISYEDIMNNVFKIKEREKNVMTDRLKSLTDEEREIDNMLKANKLGEWGKGLRKGLTTYVAEDYDADMAEMEKNVEMENKFKRTRGYLEEDEYNNLDLDEFQEQFINDENIEREEYDISAMDQDYDDGRFGDFADVEGEVNEYYED